MIREFKVRQESGATEHEIRVDHKSFEGCSDQERRLVFEKGLQSITIDVQRGLRTDLANGLRGTTLQASAQDRWNKVWNGMKQTSVKVTVVEDMAYTDQQVEALKKQGILVKGRSD